MWWVSPASTTCLTSSSPTFQKLFASPQRGTEVFGFVTTGGELLNALIMFCAPAIVNRIGAKNALLTAGMIMSVRILGSSFASSAVEVVILKMLHMFEIPFLLVGTFKYISSAFNPRLSATLFLIGFNLSKQLSGVVLSAWVGRMYDTVGFHQAYLILGCITLSFTLLVRHPTRRQPSAADRRDAEPRLTPAPRQG
ncbi:Lactose permease [Klebsiella pneumoniae]|nr:Lactose permease [Klebsiella pneumoniae]